MTPCNNHHQKFRLQPYSTLIYSKEIKCSCRIRAAGGKPCLYFACFSSICLFARIGLHLMQFVVCCVMVTRRWLIVKPIIFIKTRSLLVVGTLLSACRLTLNPYILKLIPRCTMPSVSVGDPAMFIKHEHCSLPVLSR